MQAISVLINLTSVLRNRILFGVTVFLLFNFPAVVTIRLSRLWVWKGTFQNWLPVYRVVRFTTLDWLNWAVDQNEDESFLRITSFLFFVAVLWLIYFLEPSGLLSNSLLSSDHQLIYRFVSLICYLFAFRWLSHQFSLLFCVRTLSQAEILFLSFGLC